jgi:hypothetical protein
MYDKNCKINKIVKKQNNLKIVKNFQKIVKRCQKVVKKLLLSWQKVS